MYEAIGQVMSFLMKYIIKKLDHTIITVDLA